MSSDRDKLREEISRIQLKVVEPAKPIDWPKSMAPAAFIGIAGDFVRRIAPHTEADPVALLANFLVFSGVFFGREAWAEADGKKHYPVEFVLTAGATSSGRKGTATTRVREIFDSLDPFFDSRILSGLSSGEGLIKAVSSREGCDEVGRFLVMLPEFASLLAVMKRDSNTMSPIVREAWDGNRLRVLTRKESLDANNVNISIIAHITREELLSNLSATERANGFANRFLILRVKRPHYLAEGREEANFDDIVDRLRSAVNAAQGRKLIRRDGSARELWKTEYPRLTDDLEGISGALCGRAAAHVLRLSLIYALLDSADSIRRDHLEAALAFWDYCEESVTTIFGTSTGDPQADKILHALATGPKTMSDLHRVFQNNCEATWIQKQMANLVSSGKIVEIRKEGDNKKNIQAWVTGLIC
jgi:uncharacterized protein DUF3987